MKANQVVLLTLCLILIPCTVAAADVGIPWVGSITSETPLEVSLFILPDGSGAALTQAQPIGGVPLDASLTVRLIDVSGFPIFSFPLQDIWLESETATVGSCIAAGAFWADSNTDINGVTTFVSPPAGGGWTEGPIWVYLNGMRATHPQQGELAPVAIRFNSADINGDDLINLSDVAIFVSDLNGAYHYRSDFYWDGVVNLVDVVKMVSGFNHDCP